MSRRCLVHKNYFFILNSVLYKILEYIQQVSLWDLDHPRLFSDDPMTLKDENGTYFKINNNQSEIYKNPTIKGY